MKIKILFGHHSCIFLVMLPSFHFFVSEGTPTGPTPRASRGRRKFVFFVGTGCHHVYHMCLYIQIGDTEWRGSE